MYTYFLLCYWRREVKIRRNAIAVRYENERSAEVKNRLVLIAIVLLTALWFRLLNAEEPITLRWKFETGKQYVYEYRQELLSKTDAGSEEDTAHDLAATVGGRVLVICREEGAKVHFSIKTIEETVGGEPMHDEVLKGMTAAWSAEFPILPDGTIKQGRYGAGGNIQFWIDSLFPLPQKPLIPGKKVEQEMVMFASGMLSNLEGKAEYTYLGREKVKGLDCVKYHVSCNLSSKSEPGQQVLATGDHQAEADALFAVDAGYFVSIETEMQIKIEMQIKMAGSVPHPKAPDKFSMEQRHKTSLRLKGVEDIPPQTEVRESEPAKDTGLNE